MARESFDLYERETDLLPVNFEGGALTEIQGRVSGFATCRVVAGGKAGYHTAFGAADEELVARATEAAAYGPELDVDLPGPAPLEPIEVYAEDLAAVPAAELVAWGRRIIDGVREGLGRELPVTVKLTREIERLAVRNSAGVDYRHAATALSVLAQLADAQEGDIHEVFDFEYSSELGGVDPDRMVRTIVDYYERGRETTSFPTGTATILIHPFALPQFLLPLLAGLDGERIKDGTSPLVAKVDERIFSERVTVTDDPFRPGLPASAPFDGEGVAARRRPLVEGGVLRSFNHTLETAKAVGHEPTGGAQRGPEGKPTGGVFNLVVEAGETPYEEMLSTLDRGLFLRYMSGSGQANNLAGEFSMGVYSGFLVENGRLAKRLKNVMVAGNVYDVFQRVTAISAERIPSWLDDSGNALMPYVLLEGVPVAGS
jgi:PmbA protein